MSETIEFCSWSTIKLVRAMASDDMVVQAAQVSSKGENKPETVPERLINALMAQKHGSPFEHNAFTFFVETPIFVIREWQRHRISSFNEMSGRYTTLPGKFYIPAEHRPLINLGTKMRPEMEHNLELTMETQAVIRHQSEDAWHHYQWLLGQGVANEMARAVLPLNVYSQMYWTVNARSLMNFLSLRRQSDKSLIRTYPQYEIDDAAHDIEAIFRDIMPLTYDAFIKNGRVAP